MRTIYTENDLKVMQNWSLERKIKVTQTRSIEWYLHYKGNIAVAFSGGVDSTVLLDLTRRIYPEVEAVFSNTTMEFPEIIKFVKSFDNVTILRPKINYTQVIAKYGYPVISKEISNYVHRMRNNRECMEAYYQQIHLKSPEWIREHIEEIPFSFLKCMLGFSKKRVAEFIYSGMFPKSKFCIPPNGHYMLEAPFEISDRCCYHLKKAPAYKYCRKTGKKMIVGTMAEESLLRKQIWLKQGCNAFNASEPKSTPLSFWTSQDILQYLKLTDIPYCSLYGEIITLPNGNLGFSGYQRTGCAGCLYGCQLEKEPNRLQKLKTTHPAIYNYLFDKLDYAKVCDYIGIAY